MRLKGMVVLLVVLAAIMPLSTVSASSQKGQVGVVGQPLVSPFSVSFTGTDCEEVGNLYLGRVKGSGQPITVLRWGGKYQIRLNGHEEPNAVYAGIAGLLGKSTYVRADLRDWAVWRLTAEVVLSQEPNRVLELIEVREEGPRTGLNVTTSIPRASAYIGGTNSWLQRSLRKQAAEEMAQKVYDRLVEMEELEAANRRRDAEGKVVPQTFHYTLLSINNEVQPVMVSLTALDETSTIAVLSNGRQIGTLQVQYFNADHTRVSMAGDTWTIKKGNAFKVVQ